MPYRYVKPTKGSPSSAPEGIFLSRKSMKCLGLGVVLFAIVMLSPAQAFSQLSLPGTSPATAPSEGPKDPLGRTTPRGTVLGFLASGQKGENDVAAQYLNTRLPAKPAALLAHQLFVVLDRRLPARLNQLSNKPEGSLSGGLDQELVGTISTNDGSVDILVERVDRGTYGPVWLFSSKTLEAIPAVYEEVNVVSVQDILPGFLVNNRVLGIVLFQWIAVLIGMPLLYLLTILLNRLLSALAGLVRRRIQRRRDVANPELLPTPVRLLLLAFVIRWMLTKVYLPLVARQFWSAVAAVIAIAGCLWLFLLLSGRMEGYIQRRLHDRSRSGFASILRLGRRAVDVLGIFAAILVLLHHFGINPTAALAGFGVGGIAIALAAQKTLENVVGGVSIILDHAVRTGDILRIGDTIGTVEQIGLRSTRIRTFDRTVIIVPNGQIANMSLETLSLRDKFWFHPSIGLRYETTPEQIRSVADSFRKMLSEHSSIDQGSIRVRFLRFGAFSLDLEIFAYVFARDWPHFLQVQEELLLRVMEIVQQAGAQIAIPSQTMYLTADSAIDATSLAKTLSPESKLGRETAASKFR